MLGCLSRIDEKWDAKWDIPVKNGISQIRTDKYFTVFGAAPVRSRFRPFSTLLLMPRACRKRGGVDENAQRDGDSAKLPPARGAWCRAVRCGAVIEISSRRRRRLAGSTRRCSPPAPERTCMLSVSGSSRFGSDGACQISSCKYLSLAIAHWLLYRLQLSLALA